MYLYDTCNHQVWSVASFASKRKQMYPCYTHRTPYIHTMDNADCILTNTHLCARVLQHTHIQYIYICIHIDTEAYTYAYVWCLYTVIYVHCTERERARSAIGFSKSGKVERKNAEQLRTEEKQAKNIDTQQSMPRVDFLIFPVKGYLSD